MSNKIVKHSAKKHRFLPTRKSARWAVFSGVGLAVLFVLAVEAGVVSWQYRSKAKTEPVYVVIEDIEAAANNAFPFFESTNTTTGLSFAPSPNSPATTSQQVVPLAQQITIELKQRGFSQNTSVSRSVSSLQVFKRGLETCELKTSVQESTVSLSCEPK